jgi:hypothetical protein
VKTNSLTAISGVNNNTNFAFRFVSEFENTAANTANTNYVPANSSSYGTSGTMRYDMVTVSGAFSRRRVHRDGITARQHLFRPQQTQPRFRRLKTISPVSQPNVRQLAQTPLIHHQRLAPLPQQLRRTNAQQPRRQILPGHLPFLRPLPSCNAANRPANRPAAAKASFMAGADAPAPCAASNPPRAAGWRKRLR